MSVALVFPGQGSQAVGMGKALADAFAPARRVFEEVDAALSDKLSAVMWNGPAETLTLTENTQPALLAVSLAALRVLEAEAQRAERASNQGIRVIRCDVAKSVAQVVTGDVSARRKRRGSGDVGEDQTERQQ